MESSVNDNNHKWMILATVSIGTALGRLGQTVVDLATPHIITDFSVTVSDASWVATAYILANAVIVPVWAKIGGSMGYKKIYIIGLTIFIISSFAAGIAWDLNSMIVCRILQGIAGATSYPTSMALIANAFSDKNERARAFGLWSAIFSASSILGVIAGGPLIDALGWRSIFFINIPIGIVGLIMASAFIPESTRKESNVSFDWWGAITFVIAVSSLVIVLNRGSNWGWTASSSITCYVTMLVFAFIFYLVERRHSDPIVNLKFFGNWVLMNTLFDNFVVFLGLIGSLFVIPVFAQGVLGYDTTQSGVLFIPVFIGIFVGTAIGNSLSGRVQAKYIIATST